jgi:uncharacterized protein YlxW (UPF0749 family)
MLNICCRLLLITIIGAGLAGCASTEEKSDAPVIAPVVEAVPSNYHAPSDILKISDLERQLAKEQRQYLTDKRKLELSLKDSQKQNEELQKKVDDLQKKLDDLQKKLDALLAIDRDLRNRSSRNH